MPNLSLVYARERQDIWKIFSFAGIDDAAMQYVPDYRVNLIAPGNMTEEEIEEFLQYADGQEVVDLCVALKDGDYMEV